MSENSKSKTDAGKHPGGFWVSGRAIDALVENGANAEQICAYLVLARFNTSPSEIELQYSRRKSENTYSPIFSTAGKQALKTYLGFTPQKAGRVLKSLGDMETATGVRLVFSKSEWSKISRHFSAHVHLFGLNMEQARKFTDTPLMIAKKKGLVIWYALNTFGESRSKAVWFPNSLVEGIKVKSRRGALKRPLKTIMRLPQINDAAIRLLVLAYKNFDVEYGGAEPCSTIMFKYELKHVDIIGACTLWKTERHKISVNEEFASKVRSNNPGVLSAQRILAHPDVAQLFYWHVLVVDGSYSQIDASAAFMPEINPRRVLYELDLKKDRIGYRPAVYKAYAKNIENEVRKKSYPIANRDKNGAYRFNGKYPVLAELGADVSVLGILCPRLKIPSLRDVSGEMQKLRELRADGVQSLIADMDKPPRVSKNIKSDDLPPS